MRTATGRATASPARAGRGVMLAVIVSVTVTVHAQRWPAGQTIAVWIDPAHAPLQGEELVTRALAAWNAAAGGRVALERVTDRDAAAIRVRFAASDAAYGETDPRIDPRTGAIVSAEVTVANDPGGDRLTQRIAVYLTALHEMGHALGLPHSDRFTSIMYRFRRPDDGERFFTRYRATLKSANDVGSPRATGLSDDDVRALRARYDH